MNKITSLLILSLLSLLTSCSAPAPQEESQLIDIAYKDAKEEPAPLLSTLVTDISYVALETTDSTLGNYFAITLTDKYIIADTSTGCHIFDKRDGKYIRTIGIKDDQGPLGYHRFTDPPYTIKNEVLMKGFDTKFKVFSIDNGTLLRTMSGEEILEPDIMYDAMFPLNDSTMLLYSDNFLGSNSYNLQFRSYDGRILKNVPSTNCFERPQGCSISKWGDEAIFYSYDNKAHIHEFTSDTIFEIDQNMNLNPRYVLGLGDALPAPNCRIENNWKEHYAMFGSIVETDRYLVLGDRWTYAFGAIYDKKSKKTIRVDRSNENNGFRNDIDSVILRC